MALLPKALASAVTIAILRTPLLFITGSSSVKVGGFDFFYLNRTRQGYGNTAPLCQW
jgi:hypothetical protein